jgi:hypothetical protein
MRKRLSAASAALFVYAASFAAGAVRADVTVQEQTTFDLAVIKAHGTMTELTSADKQRRDNALHCEGFMSIFCGNSQSGEIVRLDRDVRWVLEPKKKEYREIAFLTPEQRQALQQEMQANIEKLKQCPAGKQAAPAPDTQKCQMTPPKFDLVQTDTHASLVGHDARLTQITMTESCANPDTGDSCDFQISMEEWLSQEQIAGLDDRRAFQKAYMHKLGLDEYGSLVQSQMQRFLAPYQESLKQLAGKVGDIKGYPLKSTVRIAFGGPHCAAAQNSQNGSASSSDSSTSSGGGLTGAVASKLGGLFAKKKADAPADSTPTASPLPAGMVQAAQFTVETQSITPGPIDPSQFEVPAGWKLITPEPNKKAQDVSCPST